MPETISSNIERINERIALAAGRAGRRAEDVTLIAVSKLHSPEEIDEAAACGIKDIGESKVQEILRKYPLVQSPLNWHFIGHLQTNKVRSVIGRICAVHSVDSFHLAQEIDRRSAQAGLTTDILIQVNAAGEDTKFGLGTKEAEALANEIAEQLENVKIRGLMEIAPFEEDPEDVRIYFRQVADLFRKMKEGGFSQMDMISMGMSHDFEVAIEEGATHVRVGTAIFGERDYNKR